MAELTSEERKMITETHDTVREIKVVLLGVNGDKGLVGEVQDLKKKHSRLSKILYILVGVLIGTGILVGGVWGIFTP